MLTWVVRFEHWWAPVESEATAATIAEIIDRPCFADCSRLHWGRGDRWSGHAAKSDLRVREYLLDARNEAVFADSGRGPSLTASMRIDTGTVRRSAPCSSYVVVPCPDDTTALEQAACDLARALQAVVGAMTVLPVYRWAEKFAYFNSPTEERAREMGLSEQRRTEWSAWGDHRLARETEIAGPEWGLFLGPGHLAKVSPATLRASNAFAEVRELGDDRAFLRLTDDPQDALAPDYESRLDEARAALRPILADLSQFQ